MTGMTSFRPLTGKWSLLQLSIQLPRKRVRGFPFPYGEVVIVTLLFISY